MPIDTLLPTDWFTVRVEKSEAVETCTIKDWPGAVDVHESIGFLDTFVIPSAGDERAGATFAVEKYDIALHVPGPPALLEQTRQW